MERSATVLMPAYFKIHPEPSEPRSTGVLRCMTSDEPDTSARTAILMTALTHIVATMPLQQLRTEMRHFTSPHSQHKCSADTSTDLGPMWCDAKFSWWYGLICGFKRQQTKNNYACDSLVLESAPDSDLTNLGQQQGV